MSEVSRCCLETVWFLLLMTSAQWRVPDARLTIIAPLTTDCGPGDTWGLIYQWAHHLSPQNCRYTIAKLGNKTWLWYFVIVFIVDNNFHFVSHLNRFKQRTYLINKINNGSICKAYRDQITKPICAAKDSGTNFYWLPNLGVSYLFDFQSILRPINNLYGIFSG